MKAGTIVRIPGYHRPWVALPVTRAQVRRGLNTHRSGMHLFGGPWYGKNLMDNTSYGKIIPLAGPRRVIGHVRVRRTRRGELAIPSRARQRLG